MNKLTNILENENIIFTLILFSGVLFKIGYSSFSFTFVSIFFFIFTPFIILKIFLNNYNEVFKDKIFISFILFFIIFSISLILNFNIQNLEISLIKLFKPFEIIVFLIIYLNARFLIKLETINHKRNILSLLAIFIYFFTDFISISSYIIQYLKILPPNLLLSDYTMKLNSLNDYVLNLKNFDLIKKGTTTTNLSYIFAFINVLNFVYFIFFYKTKFYLLLFLNIFFIIFSILITHNTFYLTFITILSAFYFYFLLNINFKLRYKILLIILSFFIMALLYLNINELVFFNKITNQISLLISGNSPRLTIWLQGINLVSDNKLHFFFGVFDPSQFTKYDFFESLILDVFVKYGFFQLILITYMFFYITYIILKFNLGNKNNENIKIYSMVMLFFLPSFILNNFFNSNMLFSETFAPIFFHILGLILSKK